jgi:hypothetical protein
MQSLLRVAFLVMAFFAFDEVVQAGIAPSAPIGPAVAAGPAIELPLVVGQYSNESSSSSSRVRIPRGIVKLGIFVVVALFGAAGWVIKKMTAG